MHRAHLYLFGGILFILWISPFFILDKTRLLDRPDIFVWRTKLHQIEQQPISEYDVVYIGDSQVMGAILPGRIEQYTGLHGLNLGLPAIQPEGMEIVLKQVLNKSPHIRFVVLGIGPYSVLDSDNFGAFIDYYRQTMLPGYLSADDLYHHAHILRKALNDSYHILQLLLPPLRVHERLRPLLSFSDIESGLPHSWIIKNPELIGVPRFQRMQNNGIEINGYIDRSLHNNRKILSITSKYSGYWTWNSYSEPAGPPCDTKTDLTLLPVKPNFQVRDEAIESYRRMLALLQERNVQVLLIRIPLAPEWYNLVSEADAKNKADRAIKRVLLDSSAGIYGYKKGLPAGAFHDFTHLSGCGAYIYSDDLARAMRKRLKM